MSRFLHTMLRVGDLQRSIDFYTKGFGMTEIRRNDVPDGKYTLAFVGFSLPTFFTGILLILVFSIQLDWFPFVYRADISETGWRWWWEHVRQSIMPVCVIGCATAGAVPIKYQTVLMLAPRHTATTANSFV